MWAKGIEATTFEAGCSILARFVRKGAIPQHRLHVDLRLLFLGGAVNAMIALVLLVGGIN